MKSKTLKLGVIFFIGILGVATLAQAQNVGKIYERDPDRVLVCHRDSLQKKGNYKESLIRCLSIEDSLKKHDILYKIAVSYAHLNQEDSAFFYLRQFIKVSQDDRFLILDTNLNPLRLHLEQWAALLKEIEAMYLNELKESIDTTLALRLFYLGIDDQKYRLYLPLLQQLDIEKASTDDPKTQYKNIAEIKNILDHYGFPTISMVGELGSSNAFYLLQHVDKITNKYYFMAKKAFNNKDFNSIHFAMLTDRWLTQKNRKQIYGTQLRWNSYKIEKVYPGKSLLWPVKDFKNINQRRKEMGFTYTVEEYVSLEQDWYIPEEYYQGKGSLRLFRR